MVQTIKIWLAASKSGQLRVFTSAPERDDRFGVWKGNSKGCITAFLSMMESDGLQIPELKWNDAPVEIEITVKI